MIQAVIFDVGGVLVRTQNRNGRHLWEQKLGLYEGQADEVVFNSPMGQKAQHGQITEAELWQWVGQHLELSAKELPAFQAAFWAGDVLDEALIQLIRGLRPRYQTAIISNATSALRQTLTTKYPIADAFDLIVCSGEEGIMKPNAAIYERTLARLGRTPAEAVFVDDFAHNIAGAQAVGMAGILFQPTLDLAAALRQWGVAV